MNFLIAYLIVLNIAGYAVMGVDKQKAKQKQRRIPERRLFLIALVGGAAGMWLGMRFWHHKTKHPSFTIGIPLLLVLNVTGIFWIVTNGLP